MYNDIFNPTFLARIIVAPSVLHMLQHALGYEVFWKGIKIFLYNGEYKK